VQAHVSRPLLLRAHRTTAWRKRKGADQRPAPLL